MKKKFLIIVSVVMLSSCATTLRIEPNEENDSLVIGQIVLNAKNYECFGDSTVNGKHVSQIELTFMNITTGDKVIVKSQGSDGIFYFSGLSNSRYQLAKVYYKNIDTNRNWAYVYCLPNDLFFDITENKVFNLGKINWTSDKNIDSDQIRQELEYDEIENILLKKYPNSIWNIYSWDSVVFK